MESTHQHIRNKRTFFLGAGFSAEAGIPLTNSLLSLTMQRFQNDCPGIFERINNYARIFTDRDIIDYNKVNFPELCTFLEFIELREYGGGERWSDSGSREKLALKYYLADTIAAHSPEMDSIPDLYLRFAEQLQPGDFVITFNWDCLLEAALMRVGKTYNYNNEAAIADNEDVFIAKLHGSINWRLGPPSILGNPANTLNWQKLHTPEGMRAVDLFHTARLLKYEHWFQNRLFSEVEPFLVLPGYGKAFDVRFNADLWYKPDWALALSHDVYIVGLSLAPDDFFISSFFLDCLPSLHSYSKIPDRKLFIINPDSKCIQNYDFVLSKGVAEFIQEPFQAKHVGLMESRLLNS